MKCHPVNASGLKVRDDDQLAHVHIVPPQANTKTCLLFAKTLSSPQSQEPVYNESHTIGRQAHAVSSILGERCCTGS